MVVEQPVPTISFVLMANAPCPVLLERWLVTTSVYLHSLTPTTAVVAVKSAPLVMFASMASARASVLELLSNATTLASI